ncbi:MmgE/PrpD family protein [Elioraea rosea]|uniref:MmgE/PrpD family protein n=1 Tax=Elioraea rosea TaxID=2492390 RepID=UPI001183DA73|nr:MmgE/PrpD family protein [Elioraea rosea]
MMPDAEAALLRHVLDAPEAAVPAAAREAARVFVLDTLAVGIAGTAHADQPGVLSAVRRWGDGDAAKVWGEAVRLPAAQAAFVNAFQAHVLEFDAIHEAAVAHAVTPTLAAALAEAERLGGVTGGRLLSAVVFGLDLACTIGAAARGQMRFFRPATAGMFGAYGAVARLRAFDLATGAGGAGLLLGQIPGTMQAHHEGGMALAVQMGFAAAAGIRAADLAEAGARGPAAWLTGRSGFLAMTEPEHDLAPGLAALGQRWQVEALSHKPFPSGRLTHPVIDGLQRLLAQEAIDATAVREVRLHLPPLAMRLVGRPLRDDLTPNYARLCLPYVAATTLRFGTVTLADFNAPCLADPKTLALAGRVRLIQDDNSDPNAIVPQTVEVEQTSTLRVTVSDTIGSPANPLSVAARMAKAAACLAAARTPRSDLSPLACAVEALDRAPDIDALIRAV